MCLWPVMAAEWLAARMGSKCPPFLKRRGASLESVTLQNLTWALYTAGLFHALIGTLLLYSDDCAGGLCEDGVPVQEALLLLLLHPITWSRLRGPIGFALH